MSRDRIEFAKVLIGRDKVGISITVPMNAWYEFLAAFEDSDKINPRIATAFKAAIESIDSRSFYVEKDE